MRRLLPVLFSLSLLSCAAAPAFADTPPPAAALVDAGAAASSGSSSGVGSNGIATSPGVLPDHGHVGDPAADPGAVLSQIRNEKEQGGWLAAGILIAFILGQVVIRLSGHVGWLAAGRRYAGLVAIVGVLGACVDKFATQASWQSVIAAGAAALATFLSPSGPITKEDQAAIKASGS